MGNRDALAGALQVGTTALPGRMRLATVQETLDGTAANRAVTPVGVMALIDEVTAEFTPAEPTPTFVIGPTNTLEAPGLWLRTDSSGVPQGLFYDDHDGAAGSNTDGMVAAGQTNPLTKPGLWVKQNAQGAYTGLAYYDGVN